MAYSNKPIEIFKITFQKVLPSEVHRRCFSSNSQIVPTPPLLPDIVFREDLRPEVEHRSLEFGFSLGRVDPKPLKSV